jgi:hypothetical protein
MVSASLFVAAMHRILHLCTRVLMLALILDKYKANSITSAQKLKNVHKMSIRPAFSIHHTVVMATDNRIMLVTCPTIKAMKEISAAPQSHHTISPELRFLNTSSVTTITPNTQPNITLDFPINIIHE